MNVLYETTLVKLEVRNGENLSSDRKETMFYSSRRINV